MANPKTLTASQANWFAKVRDGIEGGTGKTFSGFSRTYQFAAASPVRGQVRLGLSLDPQEYGLEYRIKSDSWSERLRSVLVISAPKEIDDFVKALIRSAWKVS